MPEDFSPEEKLLNLIKKKARPSSANGAAPQTGGGQAQGPEKEAKAPRNEGAAAAVTPSSITPDFGDFTKLSYIRTLNTVLFGLLILLILFFAADIFLFAPEQEGVLTETAGGGRIAKTGQIEQKPFEYYAQSLGAKEVFKAVVREEPRQSVPAIPVEEIVGSLELLGIVSGAVPQAVIMDKKLNRRFFISEGQSRSGVELIKIGDGFVTVRYKGEEFNLSL